MLITLLLPSLVSARREAQRTYCLASLHQLATASAAYSQDDLQGQMIAAPRNADSVALIDGIYDYGGTDSTVEDPASALHELWGSKGPNSATARPINRLLFGVGMAPDPKIFRCPGDFGWVEAPDAPRSLTYTGFIGQPFWRATGTSYRANASRAADVEVEPPLNAPLSYYRGLAGVHSMGPYLRPSTRYPRSSELVLYSESIMWEALWNSPAILGGLGTDLPGWHGRMGRFNASFSDGHARTVKLTRRSVEPAVIMGSKADESGGYGRTLWERGESWRFDTMPEPLIADRSSVETPEGG